MSIADKICDKPIAIAENESQTLLLDPELLMFFD